MDCTHHWKIATPNGAASVGVCRRCGAERAFANSSDSDIWTGDEARRLRTLTGIALATESTPVNHIRW